MNNKRKIRESGIRNSILIIDIELDNEYQFRHLDDFHTIQWTSYFSVKFCDVTKTSTYKVRYKGIFNSFGYIDFEAVQFLNISEWRLKDILDKEVKKALLEYKLRGED